MPQLALFPLQLVVFPGESLNLHIFEPRYRKLVDDCESNGISFGIPSVIGGSVRPIATEVELLEVAKRHPGGESDIRTIGKRVFSIDSISRTAPGQPYPGGDVTFLPVEMNENPEMNREIIALARSVYQRLGIKRRIKDAELGFRTFDLAHYVGLTVEQEYELLTRRKAEERQLYLLEHLQKVQPQTGDPYGIQTRAELNGHFKDLKPPDF